jgi:predicted RND superfamily exporter protein
LLIGWRVRFDYNVLNLQSRGLESVETELRLLRADAQSTIYAAVIADSLEETRKLHQRLKQLPTVHSVASVAPLIPEQQEEKARLIRDIQKELGKVRFANRAWRRGDSQRLFRELDALHTRADRLAKRAAGDSKGSEDNKPRALADTIQQTRAKLLSMEDGNREQVLRDYQRRFYRDLETQLQVIETQETASPMTVDDLPRELRRLFVGQTGKFLLRVYPRENIWDREPLVRFVKDVRSVDAKATGTPMGLYEFVDVLLRGYRNAALWALLVITIMIFADFRTLWGTILTVLPLLVGTAWMVGIMSVAGVPFNPANIMVLPLLVGIGVAYGIYIVKRCRQDGEPMFYEKSTGRAVVLTALAAMAAFGSLLISAHRGIRSLGLLTVIGISACLIAAMILLPALVQLIQRKKWKL